jgi:hypothetical protein
VRPLAVEAEFEFEAAGPTLGYRLLGAFGGGTNAPNVKAFAARSSPEDASGRRAGMLELLEPTPADG